MTVCVIKSSILKQKLFGSWVLLKLFCCSRIWLNAAQAVCVRSERKLDMISPFTCYTCYLIWCRNLFQSSKV